MSRRQEACSGSPTRAGLVRAHVDEQPLKDLFHAGGNAVSPGLQPGVDLMNARAVVLLPGAGIQETEVDRP
ncbi:hypothetical protein ACFU6I_23355 [Streptomyces sp. NPDC057486]|uniref:hypothetical protein n=1 Tax=Streptomyces sp. NPDC057486 TaxID=3346145 RepID=UPI0036BC86AF